MLSLCVGRGRVAPVALSACFQAARRSLQRQAMLELNIRSVQLKLGDLGMRAACAGPEGGLPRGSYGESKGPISP